MVLNVVVATIGVAGLGWQVYRNVAQGEPYLWAPFAFNALLVVMALGLLTYLLRLPPD